MEPTTIKQLPKKDDVGQIIQKYFTSKHCEDYVLVGEEETCMPIYYKKFADAIKNFEVHDSDIFVCTFPKVGTTWTQEMVWLIINDLDYEGAKVDLKARIPFLEFSATVDVEEKYKDLKNKGFEHLINSVKYANQINKPRIIKSHLPFSLLPDQIRNGAKSPKIIYVMRDPRDACVSYYHHGKLLLGWQASMEDFCKVFMTNKIMYGLFWKHLFGFWQKQNLPNFLFITYEDMKRDLPSVVKKVTSFLGKSLTEEQIEPLCKHLSFESMKKNDAVNLEPVLRLRRQQKLIPAEGEFIRSGTVGKYKEELSPEVIQKFNTWIKENTSGTSFAKECDYTWLLEE